MWKKEQAIWEDYRKIIRVGRNVTRKAKAHLELSLAEDIRNIKKGFTNISRKRKIRRNVGLLLIQMVC